MHLVIKNSALKISKKYDKGAITSICKWSEKYKKKKKGHRLFFLCDSVDN